MRRWPGGLGEGGDVLENGFHFLQRDGHISERVGRGKRALFRGEGKKEHSAGDQALAHPLIEGEVVVFGKIVPVHREMIHEIKAESRALTGDHRVQAEAADQVLQTSLEMLAERFDLAAVNLPLFWSSRSRVAIAAVTGTGWPL